MQQFTVTNVIDEPSVNGKTLSDLERELNALDAEFKALMAAGEGDESVLVNLVTRYLPTVPRIAADQAALTARREALTELVKSHQRAQVARRVSAEAKSVQKRLAELKQQVDSYALHLSRAQVADNTAAVRARQVGIPQATINAVSDQFDT